MFQKLNPASLVQPRPSVGTDASLDCAVAERCGGCPEYLRSPSEQRRRKVEMLRSGLVERGVTPPRDVSWLTSGTLGYRNRIRVALVEGEPGYFNAAKDPRCSVLEPELLDCLTVFQEWAASHREALRAYRVAEVRVPDADGIAAVYLRHTERNGVAMPAPPEHRLLPERFPVGVVAVEGGPVKTQRFWITDHTFAYIPIGGFMQINHAANQLMVKQVLEWAAALEVQSALDLFAGSGNFALPLAHAGAFVVAIEGDGSACSAIEQARVSQGLKPMNITSGDALTRARALADLGSRFDLVIADPPRGGLRSQVSAVAELSRRAAILVSCDAQRFCIDAAALVASRMQLERCVCVDMFPHTRHFEVMGLFTHGDD